MAEEFEISDIDRVFEVGPFSVTTELMVHPTEAYGFRVTAGGKSIAYSGDTGPTDRLVDLARGADLALFEASFLDGDNPVDLHLTAREAADHAQRAGAGRLLLTHLVPWNDPDDTREQAAGHFDGPMDLAEVGMRVAL